MEYHRPFHLERRLTPYLIQDYIINRIYGDMMKRLCLVLYSVFLLLAPSALSQSGKVVVIADSAPIYAEPDSSSYMIETVSKGAVLTLFQKSKIRKAWYYVAFDSKTRKGRVSGFIHDTLVEDSHQVQKSMKVGQSSEKEEERFSISSLPKPETAVLSGKKRALPEKRVEELSSTPPSKPVPIQVMASATKEVVAFKVQREASKTRIIEKNSITPIPKDSRGKTGAGGHLALAASSKRDAMPFQERVKMPVEIESREIALSAPSPTLEDRVFQNIIVPPVWIKARNVLSAEVSPSAETETYQALKASKPVRVEELSITPFSREGALASAGIRTDQSGGGNGSRISLMASPSRDIVAFQEIAIPLVEITGTDLPFINPLSEMESIVFQKSRETSPLGEAKEMSFRGVNPPKKVTSEKILREKPEERESPQEHKTRPIPTSPRKVGRKFKWITLGLGYGQSLGGAGGFVQLNTKSGMSFHGGVGYYPTKYIYSGCEWVKDVTLFTGGIKYYLPLGADPLRFYLDLQFGGIGVEAAQIINGIWQYNFIFDYKQKTLWGPSFLGGLELKLGSLGLNGAVGLSYNTTHLDWDIQDYFLTFDLGFLLYF